MCNEVTEGYSKSLDKIRQKLISDNDPTILQYMPKSAAKHEQDRRYIAFGYGEEKADEIDKSMTEEEWLLKEKKEIEEVEKTVTIRFANYTTLMRAQTLTQGLSAQLAMFLANIGSNGGKADEKEAVTAVAGKPDDELTKKLLEKAGIKTDVADKSEIIA